MISRRAAVSAADRVHDAMRRAKDEVQRTLPSWSYLRAQISHARHALRELAALVDAADAEATTLYFKEVGHGTDA
jgi:hypothetical protein